MARDARRTPFRRTMVLISRRHHYTGRRTFVSYGRFRSRLMRGRPLRKCAEIQVTKPQNKKAEMPRFCPNPPLKDLQKKERIPTERKKTISHTIRIGHRGGRWLIRTGPHKGLVDGHSDRLAVCKKSGCRRRTGFHKKLFHGHAAGGFMILTPPATYAVRAIRLAEIFHSRRLRTSMKNTSSSRLNASVQVGVMPKRRK